MEINILKPFLIEGLLRLTFKKCDDYQLFLKNVFK